MVLPATSGEEAHMRDDSQDRSDLHHPAPGARSRRRRLGVGFVVAALVLSVAAVAGAVATFTEIAEHGRNAFTTEARAQPVDLRINRRITPSNPCQDMVENVTSDVIVVDNVSLDETSGGLTPFTAFCVENLGKAGTDVVLTATKVTDQETDCTGVEGSVDATCGRAQPGELSGAVVVELVAVPLPYCSAPPNGLEYSMAHLAATGVKFHLGSVTESNHVNKRCVIYRLRRTGGEYEAQAAQSDRLTFSFRLTAEGTLSPATTAPSVTAPTGPEG
jgi:hypothetical protein